MSDNVCEVRNGAGTLPVGRTCPEKREKRSPGRRDHVGPFTQTSTVEQNKVAATH